MLGTSGTQQTGTTPINVAPEPLIPPAAPTLLDDPEKSRCAVLSKGSVWGTAVNMCAAIMGAGCLSLPQAVGSLGVVPFGVLILFTAVATHYSIVLLVAALDATGCRSFEDMSAQIIGTWNGHAVELAIIVFQYGTLVAYTIAVGDVLSPLLSIDAVQHAMPWLTKTLVQVLFWAVLMLPLSFVENISSLQISSLVGQVSLMYLVLAVAVHCYIDVGADADATVGSMGLVGPAMAPASSASAVIMFAFTCQVNIPSLYDELQIRTPETMRAVSLRACLVCTCTYVLIGLTGVPGVTAARDPHRSAAHTAEHSAAASRRHASLRTAVGMRRAPGAPLGYVRDGS
jgi:amino acid permease